MWVEHSRLKYGSWGSPEALLGVVLVALGLVLQFLGEGRWRGGRSDHSPEVPSSKNAFVFLTNVVFGFEQQK